MSLPEPFGRVWRVIDHAAKLSFIRDLDDAMRKGPDGKSARSGVAGGVSVSGSGTGPAVSADFNFDQIERHFRKSQEAVCRNYIVITYGGGRAAHNRSLFAALAVDPDRDLPDHEPLARHAKKESKDFLGAVDAMQATHGLSFEDVLLLYASVAVVGVSQWRTAAREAVETLLRT